MDRDFVPPNGTCGGSGLRLMTYWSPPRETYCGFVAYRDSRCREWQVTLYRRQIEFENPYCKGCKNRRHGVRSVRLVQDGRGLLRPV
ncbi:MAG TPA: hypothetical protein DER07_08765 [Armatimonadetes bacterium]|nr:hypothetical protein [Armatimonadota bacterium]